MPQLRNLRDLRRYLYDSETAAEFRKCLDAMDEAEKAIAAELAALPKALERVDEGVPLRNTRRDLKHRYEATLKEVEDAEKEYKKALQEATKHPSAATRTEEQIRGARRDTTLAEAKAQRAELYAKACALLRQTHHARFVLIMQTVRSLSARTQQAFAAAAALPHPAFDPASGLPRLEPFGPEAHVLLEKETAWMRGLQWKKEMDACATDLQRLLADLDPATTPVLPPSLSPSPAATPAGPDAGAPASVVAMEREAAALQTSCAAMREENARLQAQLQAEQARIAALRKAYLARSGRTAAVAAVAAAGAT